MYRQAVVVIHGIGEQMPMSTLRGFVESVSDYSDEKKWVQVYNIPDYYSPGYELRQFAVYHGSDLRTDFFEYYWAHNLRGTKASSVWAWLMQLMLRWPGQIPARIRWIYYLLWIVAVVYAVLLFSGGMSRISESDLFKLPSAVFFINIGLSLFTLILTLYMGDAARYTYAAPGNVDERNKIRKGGLDLLERLHKSGKYKRIVIVGHSLGSMIGYDLIKHYWSQVCREYDATGTYPRTYLDEYNKLSKSGFDLSTPEKFKAYQELQSNLLKEIQTRGNPWLVTDFVTLGSPLAHAELLMAESKAIFAERKKERELPTNPAFAERGSISYSQPFRAQAGSSAGKVDMDIIHHAAQFSFVRWHNLYYKEDYVGGPVSPVFGMGVRDVLLTSSSWKAKVPFLMHTKYWADKKRGKATMKESIAYLKGVILTRET